MGDMLKVCIIEVCEDRDSGSVGAFYIRRALERSGVPVDVLRTTQEGYDIELISIHHVTDFVRLKHLKQKAPVRLVGGHPMQNNPRPVIRFCDAVFCGEGEDVIVDSLKALQLKGLQALEGIPGWIISKNWVNGSVLPPPFFSPKISEENEPYLNHKGTRSESWYIEIARGCPFKCKYCELGNSTKFRKHTWEYIKKCIESVDPKVTKKINLFAPDETSLSYYNDALDLIHKRGLYTQFSSMHVKSFSKVQPKLKMNHLIRIGLDGLTEETRFRVGKKITDSDVMQFFLKKIKEGHVQFKIFMIFGYPWETLEDFKEWEYLMESIQRLPYTKNIKIRIKWTPFIPQPCTPLRDAKSQYDLEMVEKIKEWHAVNKIPKDKGSYFSNDGIMSRGNWERQCELTRGSEEFLVVR